MGTVNTTNERYIMIRIHNISLAVTLAWMVFFTAPSFGATTTTEDGGSIQTKLSANIILNKESGLRREWVAVHDNTMPVDLIGTPGVSAHS